MDERLWFEEIGQVYRCGNGPWMINVPIVNSVGFATASKVVVLPDELQSWYDARLAQRRVVGETGIERYFRELEEAKNGTTSTTDTSKATGAE